MPTARDFAPESLRGRFVRRPLQAAVRRDHARLHRAGGRAGRALSDVRLPTTPRRKPGRDGRACADRGFDFERPAHELRALMHAE
jgi:hypothetical protein